ncbi:hypothetical protein F2Q68_00025290 [Brassica cretica]|uniref:Uncharacterized protein n=1 Tax=Brassica cretica TaxID=69181 RepID=A0A8S9IEQ3_BRACR|nr:hypothetical protein F2Q68_00025290 [Brassica cretica]
MWESEVSPLDREIVFGPRGHVGTRRFLGNPEVPLDPEVVFRTQRSFGNPEVPSDPEVVFRTRRSIKDPKIVLEPRGFFRPFFKPKVLGCSPFGPGGPKVLYQALPLGYFWTWRSCGNPKFLLLIVRSYLDPEVMWVPGGSWGTRRFLKTLRLYLGPIGRLGIRRFLQTMRSYLGP